MANVKIPMCAYRVNNDGGINYPATLYKGDNSNTYTIGELCYVSGGTIVPVSTSAGAQSTGGSPFDAAAEYVVCLEDVTVATTDFIATEPISPDTIFEGFVVNTGGSDVEMDQTDIGKTYQAYIDSSRDLAVNNVTTNGVVQIEDVQETEYPFGVADRNQDSDGTAHTLVKFKFLKSLFKTA